MSSSEAQRGEHSNIRGVSGGDERRLLNSRMGDLHLRVWRRLRGSHELQPLLQIQLKQMLAG